MSYDDFCRCTPEEFESICNAYHAGREAFYRDGWEKVRMLAAITIQPHVKKKITPKTLLPFSWDKKTRKKPRKPDTDETQLTFSELVELWGDTY